MTRKMILGLLKQKKKLVIKTGRSCRCLYYLVLGTHTSWGLFNIRVNVLFKFLFERSLSVCESMGPVLSH